jgi:hypothetical protein
MVSKNWVGNEVCVVVTQMVLPNDVCAIRYYITGFSRVTNEILATRLM